MWTETSIQKTGELEKSVQIEREKLRKKMTGLDRIEHKAKALSLIQFAQKKLLLGDYEGARVQLERACKLDPDNNVAHCMLGDVYSRLEKYELSRKELEIATKPDRTHDDYIPEAHAAYGYVLRLQGQKMIQSSERDARFQTVREIFERLYDDDTTHYALVCNYIKEEISRREK